jgi:hypothetical protein
MQNPKGQRENFTAVLNLEALQNVAEIVDVLKLFFNI